MDLPLATPFGSYFLCQQAENLVHQRRPDEGGIARRVKRRRDLHYVATDEIEAFQAA